MYKLLCLQLDVKCCNIAVINRYHTGWKWILLVFSFKDSDKQMLMAPLDSD